ncbi:hypothetical protein ACFSCX_05810 [Bacillus salitolerans]|uniref:IDEAL domain-containing protein n=1 Tax=Bacillus salitolerans TaxID=1437434 RepID=A0ABW4LNL8_9BACI
MKLHDDGFLGVHLITDSGFTLCDFFKPVEDRQYIGEISEVTCATCISKLEVVTDEQIQIFINSIPAFAPDNYNSSHNKKHYIHVFDDTYIKKSKLQNEFNEIFEYTVTNTLEHEEKLIQYGKLKLLVELLNYDKKILDDIFTPGLIKH